MFARLFLLFTLVPLLDLWILIKIGQHIGFWPTLAIAILPGFLGAVLAKREGLRVLRSWSQALSEGRLPEEGIISGVLVLIGAVLLITPGIVTDVAGLMLLFPPTRRVAAMIVRWRLTRRLVIVGAVRRAARGVPARDQVVDIEAQRHDPQ